MMPRRMNRQFLLRCAFLVAAGVIFVLALLPAPPKPVLVSWQDKVEHLMLFAGLAALGAAAWPRQLRTLVLGLLIYGAAMEVAQSLTGYRVGDVFDWIADAIGISLATALLQARTRRGMR